MPYYRLRIRFSTIIFKEIRFEQWRTGFLLNHAHTQNATKVDKAPSHHASFAQLLTNKNVFKLVNIISLNLTYICVMVLLLVAIVLSKYPILAFVLNSVSYWIKATLCVALVKLLWVNASFVSQIHFIILNQQLNKLVRYLSTLCSTDSNYNLHFAFSWANTALMLKQSEQIELKWFYLPLVRFYFQVTRLLLPAQHYSVLFDWSNSIVFHDNELQYFNAYFEVCKQNSHWITPIQYDDCPSACQHINIICNFIFIERPKKCVDKNLHRKCKTNERKKLWKSDDDAFH